MGLCNPTPVGESRNTFPEAGSTPLPLTLLPCCCHGGMVDGEGGGGGTEGTSPGRSSVGPPNGLRAQAAPIAHPSKAMR